MMRVRSSVLLAVAAVAMTVALGCQTVTLASQDYRGALATAAGLTAVAVACCAVVLRLGGLLRWAAVVLASPSVFIILDLARRAPAVWRLR